jgi:hypothetical protein
MRIVSLNLEGSSAGHVVVVTTVDEVKSPQAPTGVDASPKHVALLTAGGNTMMLHHWQKRILRSVFLTWMGNGTRSIGHLQAWVFS